MTEITKKLTAAVVVLTWQDFEMTASCLHTIPPDCDVVVVDNGSDKDIARRLTELCVLRGAKYVRSNVNLGYAGGMNLGWPHASRPVVVFSNNDLTVGEGCIDALLGEFEDRPDLAAVFPAVLTPEGDVGTPAGRFLTPLRALCHAVGLDLLYPERLGLRTSWEHAEWYSGPFVAVRRDILGHIGGIPAESFMYGEDYKLCWRIRDMGLSIKLVPHAVVTHIDDASASRVWSKPEIAGLQTRELVRASMSHCRGRLSRLGLWVAFSMGATWRSLFFPTAVRRAVARSAWAAIR